ncbi:MAG: hypothetical protein QXX95_05145 [Nitrososphaerales archaeon]
MKVYESHNGKELRGKVANNIIYVYDSDLNKAKETLKHEFIEYLIDKANEPYRKLSNLFITNFESLVYYEKGRIVKALCGLI